jgi:oxygen-independent coproporphyrinogen-3 oxidase
MPARIQWEAITEALLDKYGGQAPRYTSYPTAPLWGTAFTADDFKAALKESASRPSLALSLYVHIPFCKKRCRFCGCASDVSDSASRYDQYLDALEKEIDTVASLTPQRSVTQLHLGGGTPTALDPKRLERLTGFLDRCFDIDRAKAEIALEAAPSVTTESHITALAALGFNRISLGVQDFTFEVQRAVDRIQSVEHTIALIDIARAGGLGVNLDLMYGLPKQRPDTWEETLRRVIDIRPDRLAVFGYAHVPWMRPHQKEIDERDLPDTHLRLALFRIAHDRLLDAGYVYIGMDHFALPDDALVKALETGVLSRNFQGYTVKQAARLIGFGATAISDLQTAFAQNRPATDDYLSKVNESGLATYRGMHTSAEDRLRRYVITELMCNLRIDFEQTEREFGIDFAEHFAKEQLELNRLQDDGIVRLTDGSIEVTAAGRLFVRHVGKVFDAYIKNKNKSKSTPRFSRTV